MHDDVGPRLDQLSPANSNNNSPYVADIEDWGLGLKSWSVSSPGNLLWGQGWQDGNCSGGVGRFICPRAHTPSISLCGLPPGQNSIDMTAKDLGSTTTVLP